MSSSGVGELVSTSNNRFSELVKLSEYICVARVDKIVEVAENEAPILRNELRQIENLKGAWPQEKPLVIYTVKNIEDAPEFSAPGAKVVLFLRWSASEGPFANQEHGKTLTPVNGIQGVWLYYTEKKTASYPERSLEELREVIRRDAAVIIQGEKSW